MYHYDPQTALEELNEEAVLPNPVRVRDMMLRAHLDADHSLEYNRLFVEYQRGLRRTTGSGAPFAGRTSWIAPEMSCSHRLTKESA